MGMTKQEALNKNKKTLLNYLKKSCRIARQEGLEIFPLVVTSSFCDKFFSDETKLPPEVAHAYAYLDEKTEWELIKDFAEWGIENGSNT